MKKTSASKESKGPLFLGLGTAMLAVRLVQGWIFWGGGSRRFIYNPTKLDPTSTAYMAHKLNHAMPGAIFGMSYLVQFILIHHLLLYLGIIFFTLTEFTSGLALIFGFCTRFFAFITVLLSITLMLIFGWLGSTCLDEWTMSSLNFAMGLSIIAAGGGHYSIDRLLIVRNPKLHNNPWFLAFFSGHLPNHILKRLTITFGILAMAYTIFFYGYLHGGIFGPSYHRISPIDFHIKLTDAKYSKHNNSISVRAYVNEGPDTQGAFVTRVFVLNSQQKKVLTWTPAELSKISSSPIYFKNKFAFSQFAPSEEGFIGEVGSIGVLTFPIIKHIQLTPGNYTLEFLSILGQRWSTTLKVGSAGKMG